MTRAIALVLTMAAATAYGQIWIDHATIMALPMSGPAWTNVKKAADAAWSAPAVGDQNNTTDQMVFAAALVYARTGQIEYRNKVFTTCKAAIGTESTTGDRRSLALGRNLCGYILAADLIGMDDAQFNAWLDTIPGKKMSDDRTLLQTAQQRPNNWGTMAMGSLSALAAFRGHNTLLINVATVFKGYVGDRSSWSSFKYGDLWWQFDEARPVGINEFGAIKNGINVDGIPPDDQRRSGGLEPPPVAASYPWEGLQGLVTAANILHRAGFDTWNWEHQAVLRCVQSQYRNLNPPEGDDLSIPWLVNAVYGTNFPTSTAATHGKIFGWTAWTHASGIVTPPPPPPPPVTPVASVQLSHTTLDGVVGDTVQLHAVALDANGVVLARPIAWSSSDVEVATVDQDGNVTAVGFGLCDIIATCEGKTASCLVTVDHKLTEIPWQFSDAVLIFQDETGALYYQVLPDGAIESFE